VNTTRFIVAQNKGRDPELLEIKWAKMRSGPFGFYRGAAPLFYRTWSKVSPKGAPLAWISGDAHMENLGSYKGSNRVPYFDINDFDECCLAPANWDIGRAMTALCVIGRKDLARLIAKGYAEALAGGKPGHIEPEVAKGSISKLLSRVAERNQKEFLRKWTVKGKFKLRADHIYALRRKAGARALRMFESWARHQPDAGFYKVLDFCGRIAGDGSLGLERFVFLVRGKRQPFVLDIKGAAASTPAGFLRVRQPPWASEAERVATVQHYMQYVPVARLSWIGSTPTSFIVHELEPLVDRIDIETLPPSDYSEFVLQWARLLASAQLRTAGWKGSADLDSMIAYGQALDGPARRKLVNAAGEAARSQKKAWLDFKTSGLGKDHRLR
jgi:uncharacterized protein (DUF2252 family)